MTDMRKLQGISFRQIFICAALLCCPIASAVGAQPQEFTVDSTVTTMQNRWVATGSLNTARDDFAATRLPDGKVLVIGGAIGAEPELYDPIAGIWTRTGSAACPGGGELTLLSDGKVLVVSGDCVELYDPISGTWSRVGDMNRPRVWSTAIGLADGRVLVFGGWGSVCDAWDCYWADGDLDSEIYDPTTRVWANTGRPVELRYRHTSTLLPDGRVLVAGGFAGSGNEIWSPPSAEIFDPVSGKWTNTGALAFPRGFHTATLLPNGKVLVAGGYRTETYTAGAELKSSEIFDPTTGTWSATGDLNFPRFDAVATSLSNGDVLVTGGGANLMGPRFGVKILDPEIYDATSGKWLPIGRQITRRSGHTATLLKDGRVLAAGGRHELGTGRLATVELFGNFPPGTIDAGFTGAWYDPTQAGHGLFVEVLPDNQFLAAWFTFNPAGTQQAWFLGVGTYSGNAATINSVVQPTGGRWIPNFDPTRVVNNPWGTLKFTFTDCNHGKVEFSSPSGYGSGSMNLTRLTQPAGLTCP